MEDTPVLSYIEIMSVDSIDDLIKLYTAKGIIFPRKKAFLSQLGQDWDLEGKRLYAENIRQELDSLPSLEVCVDGCTYGLYGIAHDYVLGQDYRELVDGTIKNTSGHWLFEQGLGEFIKKDDSIVDIPDLAVIGFKTLFIDRFKLGISPLLIPLLIAHYSRTQNTIREHISNLFVEPETFHELPSYVEIELKKGKEDVCQTRSAYQAEFMKHYFPGERKNFLCGAMHPAEVKYFLENGVENERIKSLAIRHAKQLMDSPEDVKIYKEGNLRFELGYSLGLISGLSPYLVAGALLFDFLK